MIYFVVVLFSLFRSRDQCLVVDENNLLQNAKFGTRLPVLIASIYNVTLKIVYLIQKYYANICHFHICGIF